jgi:hypothetical protein
MMTSKSRFAFAVDGMPVVRVVPHKEGGDKVALKCEHPEGVAMLLALAGFNTKLDPPVKGRNFFVTTMCRSEFLGLMSPLVAKVLDTTVPTAEPAAMPSPPSEVDWDEPDGEMLEELPLEGKSS